MQLSSASRRVIVVGAGHAGLEAAFAAARVGVPVTVVTGTRATIGQTPCNPSVGGVAKGHLVHEIHALGGFMGRAADACAIHGRVLNLSKGPAVHATRLQVDKLRYGQYAQASLLGHPGITTIEGLVEAVCIDDGGRVRAVRLADGSELEAAAVVITTGTFLGGVLHTGASQTPGGRVGEAPATALSQQLRSLGFRLVRLKTGTPPRLAPQGIDWAALEPQGSDDPFPRFCAADEPDAPARLPEVHCHITYTNEAVHELIRAHLHESPMYSGQIEGIGPRYCPSLEDKVVRFADKSRHQIFLEPEGLDADALIYPNGISTSLPAAVQAAFVRAIPGLEHARVVRPGYAVEYDAVDARALTHELASKDHQGVYFAGQINGTSGYEEAGIQGLLAGANAALWLRERAPLRIARDQGYAGVLVDDLVTQGCDEPYRMFTSRAEYRLLLREDNADARLSDLAHAHGLLEDHRHEQVMRRLEQVEQALAELAKPGAKSGTQASGSQLPAWIVAKARARQTYAGYLDRQRREVARLRGEGGNIQLPLDIDYFALDGLTREAAERLAQVRPTDTHQAARIPGITPAALSCVWAHARILNRRASARGAAQQ
ncbi:tRNA uridine 5-carboxymethylaminomethyl modification enzyme GidA [Enhygromyxa salina]|uniref:tRNA uridine 5-carboxymethylaminomethyl modification enzyme MnmG n=1 Tax=Enhygromyxa salina TaxID=215803 RepID=A0A0C1ZPT3_9BACT|nr:tRNA uridine-5-carboxymethylaminomethyl(34) synthesis enzyme MnmG [Enhygromyxa salina]KIG19624.1 tRNA uridine 5-carboxymethylaminomethyl modification enzyme GidA [Enhygromyxa salina]